jgi:tetratricopeptide (TPR) repeat protein
VFGGPGDREGYFRNPVDVAFIGDNILVLDSLAQSIEIFSPTLYGQALMNAVRCQYQYGYETAAEYWREALSYNHNLTLAYSGIGRMLLRAGRYEEAMEYLKKGEDRVYYDKAYEKVRTATLRQYFVPGAAALAGLIILLAALGYARRKRKGANAA